MKQDEVIFRLKSIVHGPQDYTTWTVSTPHLVMLVNSVIEMEREACAKILDANAVACESQIMRSLLQANAQAIRERGQAPAVYSSFGLMGGDAFVSGDSLKRNIT